jgi:prevent-host-death family protein
MTTAARKPKTAAAKKKAAVKSAALKAVKPAATQSVGVRELRQSASKVLDQVKEGAIIEITEHGVPVARISPITKSLYDEYIESGLIKPARNPDWRPTKNPAKIIGKKTSTDILMEMRAEERY